MTDYSKLKDKRIAVLLSGGVDSSVVVYELVRQGLHPDCFYINIGPEEQEQWDCTSEEDMAAAVNRVVELNGGIVVWDKGAAKGELQLEIAGIMSEEPLRTVNDKLESAKEAAFALGVSRGVDPFMTLSFMALPVIPTLRLTTRGVFDVTNQRYV